MPDDSALRGGRPDPHAGVTGHDPLAPGVLCPALHSERLTLEPLVAAHASELFALMDDEAVWQFTDDRPPVSAVELTERYRRLETRTSPDDTQWWLNWALRLRDGSLAGFVQATVSPGAGDAQIAYILGRRFWCAGYATEAARVMIAHLCDALGVQRLRATVDPRNVGSLRVLEKIGFERVEDDDAPADPHTVAFGRNIVSQPLSRPSSA